MKIVPMSKNIFKSNKNYVLYLIFFIYKALGVAPYNFTYSKAKFQLKVSLFGIAQSILYACILTILYWPSIEYQRRSLINDEMDVLSVYSSIFRAGNSLFVAIVVMLNTIVNRNRICKLISAIRELDEEIKEIGVEIYDKTMIKSISIFASGMVTFMVVIVMIDLVIFTLGKDLLTYIYWITSIIAFIINMAAVYQFICFLCFIHNRFKMLNKYISSLSKPKIYKKNNYIADIFIIKKQRQSNPIFMVLPNHDPVKNISKIHDRLCSLSKSLNSIYSFHILLTTNATFITLVSQLYFFYLMLNPYTATTLTYRKVWTAFVWGAIFFSQVFSISYACSKVKDEANYTSVLLYKMSTNDDSIRSSIEMFSLQMIHQNLDFTACGFFSLDFTTIYMIVGAVTTYLVFLIQFEMAGRNLSNQISNVMNKNNASN